MAFLGNQPQVGFAAECAGAGLSGQAGAGIPGESFYNRLEVVEAYQEVNSNKKTGPVNLGKAKRPGEFSSTNVGLRGIFGSCLYGAGNRNLDWAIQRTSLSAQKSKSVKALKSFILIPVKRLLRKLFFLFLPLALPLFKRTPDISLGFAN